MNDQVISGPILVAYEKPRMRDECVRVLSQQGYSVFAADSLEEGFDLLYAQRPMLTIVDARLPDRAALKLAMASRARGAKVLVVDAGDAPTDETATMRVFAGADLINKRARPSAFAKAVIAAVGRPVASVEETPHAA